MRRDYFDRYAAEMPALTALRRRSAWFGQAQVNAAPSNTAVGHSTIATGADPRVHGITGTNIYDRRRRAL
jgi:predicted AlkP superfamily pyrophosphatase or phosphodiesterase